MKTKLNLPSVIFGFALGLVSLGIALADSVTTQHISATPASDVDNVNFPAGSPSLTQIATFVKAVDTQAQGHITAGETPVSLSVTYDKTTGSGAMTVTFQ